MTTDPPSESAAPVRLAADAVRVDHLTCIDLDGRPVLLTRADGQVIAFAAACPHASGNLGAGSLHRGRIHCPVHDYRFDVRTGRAVWPPDETCRLAHYPVEEEAGIITVWPRRPRP